MKKVICILNTKRSPDRYRSIGKNKLPWNIIIMNEHLKIVFEVLLPGLEKAKINYWVYGGVGVAAYTGRFIRNNPDVDIFVRNSDFYNAKSVLDNLCKQNNLRLKFSPEKNYARPKVEINKKFSMIPIYQKDNTVLFRYKDGDQKYPNQILERVERNISGFRFFTSPNKFIKDMFINHIKARPGKKTRGKIKKDAKAILNPKDFSALGWNIE